MEETPEEEKAVKSMPMCTWGLFVPLSMYLAYKAVQWKERWDERPSKIRRELSTLNRVRGHRRRYGRACCAAIGREGGKP